MATELHTPQQLVSKFLSTLKGTETLEQLNSKLTTLITAVQREALNVKEERELDKKK